MIVQIAAATERMSSVSEQISQYTEEIAAISRKTSCVTGHVRRTRSRPLFGSVK